MAPVRFEPAIPANERPQTHILDGAASGISYWGACVFLKTCCLRLVLCLFRNDPLVTQMRRKIQAPVYTVNEIMATLSWRTLLLVPCVHIYIWTVPYIVYLSMAALCHRKPASAGTSNDSCRVQGHDKRVALYRGGLEFKIHFSLTDAI